MALADAVAGAQRPSQTITWSDEDGDALDLTGATITARLRSRLTGEAIDSDGTFTITDAPDGVFTWAYGEDDVETAGDYDVQFTATYGSEPSPARTKAALWTIHEAI